tara:strand:+ start:1600 stop:2490 length:891 start_codon:yes stop_codon:yes gene_type:complete
MSKGKLILIEGLEGAGKSSFISKLQDYLEKNEISTVCTREPGGTPIAEAIRETFKADYLPEKMDVKTELMLLYAARNQTMQYIIKPHINTTDIIISDRSWLTSFAYQQKVDTEDFLLIHNFVMKDMPEADFVIYLDVKPEVGMARARTRGELDRIEKNEIEFFHTARSRYQEIINDVFPEKHVTIDTTNISPDEVFNSAIKMLIKKGIIASSVSDDEYKALTHKLVNIAKERTVDKPHNTFPTISELSDLLNCSEPCVKDIIEDHEHLMLITGFGGNNGVASIDSESEFMVEYLGE